MNYEDIVIVDTETLGLDPDAPIWEFAAMRFAPGLPVQSAQFFIEHDGGPWYEDMTIEFLNDYRDRYLPLASLDEGKAVEEIYFITNGAVLVGCNPGFDTERLAKLMRRNGIEPAWHYHPLDSASMAIGYLAGQMRLFPPPWKSNTLSAAVGVDPERFARHTAMGDVQWTQALVQKIMSQAMVRTAEDGRTWPVTAVS